MEDYFAPEDAELEIRWGKGGGRVNEPAKIPFTIHFKRDGKPAIISPADVRAVVDGPARVVSKASGAANKYGVHLTASTAGTYTAEVTVRGKFKSSSKFRISRETSPDLCRAEGPSKTSPGKYTLTTRVVDAAGEPLTVDLGDKLAISISGPEDTFDSFQSVTNGDGTFTTTFNLTESGHDYELEVQINGVPIGNSPFRIST